MTMNPGDAHRLATAPVVVGVDGNHTCESAIRWAARTAARRRRRLHIVHALGFSSTRAVLGSYDVMIPAVTEGMRERGDRVLAEATRVARDAAPDLTVVTELSEADPAELLVAISERAHMVVLGARSGVGTLRHLGSTVLTVAAHGHGAIVVVHDTDVRETGPVVIGVDGSPVGDAAVATSFAEASERGVELVAIHAWSDMDSGTFAGTTYFELPAAEREVVERALTAERLAGYQEKYPDVRVTREVHTNGPRLHLADASAGAALLVVGSRGRGGFRGLLLGSTSTWIMQHAQCPVMIVHPEGL
ncbi:universal stress protein [Nocardia bovistercoris]|uniref:Universal stress protein n=1 Tax=Nocardia bovistercoris TaxID=2785916 RepID=A0A931IK91_9NOCA|nr:universal stress protein [Nocardia bovistercoris]MBH0781083.1 universal stress protein [Nocardia bovistercoris]